MCTVIYGRTGINEDIVKYDARADDCEILQ